MVATAEGSSWTDLSSWKREARAPCRPSSQQSAVRVVEDIWGKREATGQATSSAVLVRCGFIAKGVALFDIDFSLCFSA